MDVISEGGQTKSIVDKISKQVRGLMGLGACIWNLVEKYNLVYTNWLDFIVRSLLTRNSFQASKEAESIRDGGAL